MLQTETSTYNGWSSYETWCVALWLDNEESSQVYWNDRAEELLEEFSSDEDDQLQAIVGENNNDHAVCRQLEDELKAQHEEFIPEVTGVFADLLGHALGMVNWYEIAKHYVEAARENVDQ